MKRELRYERVENPEGWKAFPNCKAGYIFTNIGRDAIVWFSDSYTKDKADEWMAKFVSGTRPINSCDDRDGNPVPAPTPDEIIWPRFTAVEVEGGWSVLDRWEGMIRNYVWTTLDLGERSAESWNEGTADATTGWIPYVPPEPKPAPKPEPERRFCYVDNPAHYKALYPTAAYGIIDNLKELIAWGCRVHREEEFNEKPEKAAAWTWHDKQGNEVVWESVKEPSGKPEPQYIACQHGGKWEGDFGPEQWGIVRVSDGMWEHFVSEGNARDWVKLLEEDSEYALPAWFQYPRKVDDHKQPQSETQEPLTLAGDSQADIVFSPPHYTHSDIECIDAIRAALGDDGFIQFCRGVVIKYHWRAGLKGDTQNDLGKAAFYSQMAAHVGNPEKFKDPRKLDTSKNNGHDKQEANG